MNILQIGGFDYLDPAVFTFDHFESLSANLVSFVSRSGVIVTLTGTGIYANGALTTARVTQIAVTAVDGSLLTRIDGISLVASQALGWFETGQGLSRLLYYGDTIVGSDNADLLEGYSGNDNISGGGGNDTLGGGLGDDVLTGGAGNDLLYGAVGLDTAVFEGNFTDYAITFASFEVTVTSLIDGSIDILHDVEMLSFADGIIPLGQMAGTTLHADPAGGTLYGTMGSDDLFGTDGDDSFQDYYGTNQLYGGLGDDLYTVSAYGDVHEGAGEGYDHINLIGGMRLPGVAYVMADNVESMGSAGPFDSILIGNALDNAIFGNTEVDVIDGAAGNDRIHLDAGDDHGIGGEGDDSIFGASGDDLIEGGVGGDLLNGGGGDDTIEGGAGNDVIVGDPNGAEGRSTLSDTAVSGSGGSVMPDGSPPNILFISIDDLAPISAVFNHPLFTANTPNLDAFFNQASVFTNAQAAVPLCNASRAAIMYGVDSDTSGIHDNTDAHLWAREQFPSLPSFLRDNGYTTAMTGKVFHNIVDQGDAAAFDQIFLDRPLADWTPTSWSNSLAVKLSAQSPNVPDAAFTDGRIINFVEDYLGETHDDPFFFALGLFRPHAPQYVPQEYYDLYPLESIPLPDYQGGDLGDIGELALAYALTFNPGGRLNDDQQPVSITTTPEEMRLMIQSYLAAVSYADAQFGKAMAALQASAYASNTAVVLWSDHGFHLGEKTHFSKFTLWEQGTRSPFAVMLPGQTEGQVIDNTVSLIDIYRTIADMTGLQPPDHVQGASLLDLIQNPGMEWNEVAVSEMYGNYSVRTDGWRYIQYWDGTEELYDNTVDSINHDNLASDPAYASVIADLRRYLPGGADHLDGGDGNDSIYGLAGDDVLIGGAGVNLLDGGTGMDTASYAGADGAVTVDLAIAGEQDTGYGQDTLVSIENLIGSAFADTLFGDDGENVIDGGAGDDSLYGRGGDDRLIGGEGADTLDGGTGADILEGGAGDDLYLVSDSAAIIVEAADGGTDEARISAASYVAGDHVEMLVGLLDTGQALTGGAGATHIVAGGGNDTLDGGAGGDHLEGGLGDDVYIVDDLADIVDEAVDGGTDEVRTALGSYTLGDNVENLTGLSDSGQELIGNALGNHVTGGAGGDVLDGGGGADLLEGGLGDDSYLVADALAVILEAEGAGQDEVRTTLAAYVLADNVEVLTGLSDSGQTLTGNALGNVLCGGAGGDTMAAGAGDDVYHVADGDSVVEAEGEGTDEVRTELVSYTLTDNVENLTGLSDAGQALTGNALANLIRGGAGADSMVGGAGDDVYEVGTGDTVEELGDGGTDEVRTSLADYILGDNIENLTGLSDSGQVLTGNALGNHMTGGAGSDVLDGVTGADLLEGGSGDDLYLVEDAAAVVLEVADEGRDEVRTTLAAYTLTDNVEVLTGLADSGQALNGNAIGNVISGGAGSDTMAGGAGDDVYHVADGDSVFEAEGEGTDEVRTELASYALTDNVENLTGLSNAGQALTGNALANLIRGGAGADSMVGGAGDDVYEVSTGDTVEELADGGTDEVRTSLAAYTIGDNVEDLTGLSDSGQVLTGNALGNHMTGGAGSDVLDGVTGADLLEGGSGDDLYIVGDASAVALESDGGGYDELRTTAAAYVLGDHVEVLTGLSDSGQTLTGNAIGNVISGGAGADTMAGAGGDDLYLVGSGDQVVEALGEGTDEVRTELASYALTDNVENLTGLSDTGQALTGNALANLIRGGAGGDVMAGGDGDDVYEVGDGDTVQEADLGGTDEVRTRQASHSLAAHVENLTGLSGAGQVLIGNVLDNHILGAGGNDVLNGELGADLLEGGLGNDVYIVSDVRTVVQEGSSAGSDEVRTTLASYTLGANFEALTGLSNARQILTGNTLANVIRSGAGSDDLFGGDGDDVLSAGAGTNLIAGGSGIDTLDYSAAAGGIIIRLGVGNAQATGQSIDTISGFENLIGSNFADNMTGGADANRMEGGGGNDVLRGGEGSDTLLGGSGNDTLYGDNHNDTLFGDAGNDTLIGGYGDDALFGGEGSDQIKGSFGIDSMTGGLGDDYFYVDDALDQVIELGDEGYDTVYSTVSWTMSGNVERLVSQGANGFVGTGNALDNRIIGANTSETFLGMGGLDFVSAGAGNDLLYGGDGNDQLSGQTGLDEYWGGGGRDIFIFAALTDSTPGVRTADVIHDFSKTQLDKIRLNQIDAITGTAQDDAFIFIGKIAFTGRAGELRYSVLDGGTYVQGDVNGDRVSDFAIRLDGLITLVATDFIL